MSAAEHLGPRLAYTQDEAAAVIGVSKSTIKRAVAAGALKAKAVSGRKTLIRRADLEDWLDGLDAP